MSDAFMARVLVTGVCGQIGSFLAEQLIAAGHEVIGIDREARHNALAGVQMHLRTLNAGDIEPLLDAVGPLDAIVHLAGKTSVSESWSSPMQTFESNATTTAALAFAACARGIRFVHASTSEIFGNSELPLIDESAPIAPVSPYGVAKASSHLVVRFTRDHMAASATNLVFFLGESERRSTVFVFRKITTSLALVKRGRLDHVTLGNVAAVRDFCHASDYARAAAMFALGATPGDYICASGVAHAISDIATECCEVLGLDKSHVVLIDPTLFRRTDIPRLVGNSAKLRALGWKPSMAFEQLVRSVTEHDLAATSVTES
jgi:GDPmannose 4,6-dehydratase